MKLNKPIVLIGMMGSGKSTIGIRLAETLSLPFVDADTEIEKAAGRTIPDIFETFGEASFRQGEKRVIARIIKESESKPCVVATGGGAFMDKDTRDLILEKSQCFWLKAGIETLIKRTEGKQNRPLLDKNEDRQKILENLLKVRTPVYQQAHHTILTDGHSQEETVKAIKACL